MPVPKHLVGERVGNNRVELVALLGEGSYGSVYRGILYEGGLKKDCAVKCMEKSSLDAYHLMVQRREIILHQQVSEGLGIVTLYEHFEDDDYQFIVMDYCPDGDLWEGIANGQYAEKDDLIRDVFIQVLQAVEYCHSKNVFHRDIKPENILLSDGGRKVQLADFGLACGSPVSNELRCGSPWYMSPECWGGIFGQNRPYATAPNDVWSLGILLINLACGRHAPWKQATQRDLFFRDFMKQPRTLRLLLPLSVQAHDLLSRVFTMSPAARISIKDFKVAISKIKYFVIPAANREEFHDYQRSAWSVAIGPSSSHPLSAETLGIIPVSSKSPSPSAVEEEEGIDITEGAKEFFKPFVTESTESFIVITTIVNTNPHAVHAAGVDTRSPLPAASRISSASTSSAESDGPITPDMPATVVDVEVPDILEGTVQAIRRPADPVYGKLRIVGQPFQNILRAIGAL